MNGRERVLAMLDGRETDHLPLMPITMQFACDRIGIKYLQYATDYRRLVEGQLRVAEEFGLDYVNTMSDPACEAADCGAAVLYPEDSPPALDDSRTLLAEKGALATLKMPEPCMGARMANRLQAIAQLRDQTRGELLVEGWIEGPCAEAADLRGLSALMLDFYDDPGFVTDLFEWVLESEVRFARAQVLAGAELIGIGDAAASLVGPRLYREFVWPIELRMIDLVHALGARVRLHICGNTRRILKEMGELGSDLVDLDYLAPVAEARRNMGPGQTLLGNIDPVRVLRDGTAEEVRDAVAQCHREAGPRYIVGAGCEVPRDTPHANFRALTEYARTAQCQDG